MNEPSEERAASVTGGEGAADEGVHFVLTKPSIEVALAEFRFSPIERVVDAGVALEIRTALRAAGFEFASVQPAAAKELSVSVTPSGVQSSTVAQANGFQLSDPGHHTVVTILPSSVAVQVNRYERWSISLRPTLDALLTTVGDVLEPQLRTRIGLRYVNRFADARARTASHWTTRIDPELLGPLCKQSFADRVTSSQQQLDLSETTGRGQTLRHGCFQDSANRGTFSYLLDIDAYDTATELFRPNEVLDVVEALNRASAKTFRWAITDAYADELGLEEVDGPTPSQDETTADLGNGSSNEDGSVE